MDSIVTSVIKQFESRSKMGEQKYGVNMDREDLQFLEWVTHMKEELMDAILYLEKLERIYGQEAPNTQGDTE
jgi:hypothetical protein